VKQRTDGRWTPAHHCHPLPSALVRPSTCHRWRAYCLHGDLVHAVVVEIQVTAGAVYLWMRRPMIAACVSAIGGVGLSTYNPFILFALNNYRLLAPL